MIPVLLHLQNFLSYGEDVSPLDFSEFDVACLSGDNGHGKSAILDAMTWALWGEARKAMSERAAADGLLRIGSTEMQVEFVFDLERDRYRIIRKYRRKKGKRGTASLEFQVFDGESQAYKSLTEKSMKGTQDKITATLRMTYDTFINSAFILQGHVNEFTGRNPTQRKAILAEVLDLSRYEALREIAREHLRTTEKEQELMKRQLAVMAEEKSHVSEYTQKLESLQRTLKEFDEKIRAGEGQKDELDTQRLELQGCQQQLTEKQRQQKRFRQDCKQLDLRIQRQEQQIQENGRILAQENDILKCYRRYTAVKESIGVFAEQQRKHAQLSEQRKTLEDTLKDARHALEKELEKWQTERTQIQQAVTETERLLDRAQEIEHGYKRLCTSREQDEAWDAQRNHVDELERSIQKLSAEIDRERTRLEAESQILKKQIGDLSTVAGQQDEREKQVAQARSDLERLAVLEQEREKNKDVGTQCRAALDGFKERRVQGQRTLQEIEEKVTILQRSEQPQCPLCQSALNVHKKHDIEKHFQQEITQIQQEDQRLGQEITIQEARVRELRKQYKQLDKDIQHLQPVRKNLLQAEHALQESQQAVEQLQELRSKSETLTAQIQQNAYARTQHQQREHLQQQMSDIGYGLQAHQALKKELKKLQKFAGEHSTLEGARQRHQAARDRLPEIENHLNGIQATLENQEYAQTTWKELQDVQTHIQTIGYDQKGHDRIQREFQQIQEAPAQKARVEHAQKTAKTLQQTYDELLTQRQEHTELLADLNRTIVELEQQLEGQPLLERQIRERDQALQALRKQRDEVLQTRGTFQHRLERCQEIAKEYAQEMQRKTRIDRECQVYAQLFKIFGKDGIQAYLIENAIPEIEDEANDILSRLTDNRTSIAIESVKDLQSGGTRETLDIKISDELGIRSYEMYSGGEAFRVDFAIRVALSKLLANRAGTQLKTLVIDEGFGTQDARGLEQLVEAIKMISKDFEKILVITHLEALKEAFPVRIEVVKLPDIGSQYQIVH